MRIAVLSDVHSNWHALEACLDHARSQGAQAFAFLGDLVGYGAYPAQVVERIMALAGEGALVIQGNHDAMAVSPPTALTHVGDHGAAWTHAQLSPAQRAWLAGLSLTVQQGPLLLVHASAERPERWRYVTDSLAAQHSLDAASAQWPEVRYLLGGHVHQQTLYYRGADKRLMSFAPQAQVPIPVPAHRQWLATVGSVGQPRDGRTEAMYALLDLGRAHLHFFRVAYDVAAAAAAIRASGLPPFFADRLERGQ